MKRGFTAVAPDRLYVCDFTYLCCWEGRVFFSFDLDVFSRRIVGWQLASHMRATLVLDALRMALGTRQPGADVQLVHRSDAGSLLDLKRSSQQCLCQMNVRVAGDVLHPRARRSGPRVLVLFAGDNRVDCSGDACCNALRGACDPLSQLRRAVRGLAGKWGQFRPSFAETRSTFRRVSSSRAFPRPAVQRRGDSGEVT